MRYRKKLRHINFFMLKKSYLKFVRNDDKLENLGSLSTSTLQKI